MPHPHQFPGKDPRIVAWNEKTRPGAPPSVVGSLVSESGPIGRKSDPSSRAIASAVEASPAASGHAGSTGRGAHSRPQSSSVVVARARSAFPNAGCAFASARSNRYDALQEITVGEEHSFGAKFWNERSKKYNDGEIEYSCAEDGGIPPEQQFRYKIIRKEVSLADFDLQELRGRLRTGMYHLPADKKWLCNFRGVLTDMQARLGWLAGFFTTRRTWPNETGEAERWHTDEVTSYRFGQKYRDFLFDYEEFKAFRSQLMKFNRSWPDSLRRFRTQSWSPWTGSSRARGDQHRYSVSRASSHTSDSTPSFVSRGTY